MNRISYSLLLILATPLALLYFGWRALKSPDYRGRLGERFALGLPRVSGPLMIHCASMGETLAALPLIRKLQQQYPTTLLLVTTTTPTGSQQVKKHLGDSVFHCYLPMDHSLIMRRFLNKLKPKAIILMETELWPNLIHHSFCRHTPVILANARLSERSARGYGRFPKLVGPMLNRLTAVAAQNSNDGARLVKLGVSAARLIDCGSLKFDIPIDKPARQQAAELGQTLFGARPRWIAASTHPGEFEQVVASHQQLLRTHPELLLVLVPRHPEQFDHAADLCQQAGLTLQRRSQTTEVAADTQVLVGDTMGELMGLYGGCDIALVGGSLIERGGHNPLEPAAFGKPVLMGPHYFNFQEIGDQLQQHGALLTVANQGQLTETLRSLLNDRRQRQSMGEAALLFVSQNRGATERQLQVIRDAITAGTP
ncbi:lipid IV(A) 3-deoxy-D-manno-octulosonic acid transferase [Ferrimonas kyonanensis]|uniref:lipid IV(A) 3-deoxy-D-manno-octulosonic acid transferase n=1 Tax=Ferrimonas kyonanensis TaxID=364763 RepID=UPI0003F6AD0D|nr:lipid IV(A) 3-deoxy-D-manno-octulosonic acid transferase [Ferrimonas kyonanensis]